MHLALSIRANSFFCHVTACVGQAVKQEPHFLHFSSFTSNFIRFTHTLAGHSLRRMWASYSSLKYLTVESAGLGAV